LISSSGWALASKNTWRLALLFFFSIAFPLPAVRPLVEVAELTVPFHGYYVTVTQKHTSSTFY
jgi:hypothetical protein